MSCWFPRVVAFGVPKPLDQVLQLSSPPLTSVATNGLNFVLFCVSHEVRWWPGVVLSMFFCFAIRGKKRGVKHRVCYRLSKRPNCFHGTCSGLGTWRPRCTKGTSSGTRHVVPLPSLSPIALVTALLSGAASPMTPALSMTRASAPVPVRFPQLSPHVPSYRPITPSPCALGQQVIVLLSRLIVLSRLVYFYPDHS